MMKMIIYLYSSHSNGELLRYKWPNVRFEYAKTQQQKNEENDPN